jgi:hypothetical protein
VSGTKTVLEKLTAGWWAMQPDSVREDIRTIVNDRMMEESERVARIDAVLSDFPLAQQYAAERQRARTNGAHPDASVDDELDDWQPVDLGPALRGEIVRHTPTILRRADGQGLFYAGQVNGIHGDSGAGKGWVVLAAVAQELDAGNHTLWVDAEDPNETTIVGRLLDIGVDPQVIEERFHYINPKSPVGLTAVRLLLDYVEKWAVSLVVLDSIGELFGLEGISEDKDVEVGPWMRRVARPLALAGPAVIPIDHGTKAADNPLHPSGSKRKRAAVTGASYLVEVVRPLARGKEGAVRLRCAKDRHGCYAKGEHAATIEVTSYPDGGVTLNVWQPMPSETATPDLPVILAARAAVKAAKAEAEPISRNALEGLMKLKGRAAMKRAGIDLALARGALKETAGPRGARLLTYISELPEKDEQ